MYSFKECFKNIFPTFKYTKIHFKGKIKLQEAAEALHRKIWALTKVLYTSGTDKVQYQQVVNALVFLSSCQLMHQKTLEM